MAQSVLEILIKAKDMASGALKQFDKQLVKTAKDVEGVEKSNKKAVGSFTELNSLLSLVDTGLKYVSAGYQALVTDTIAYGKQVDDLSRALGTGTEEASKLIQIGDDLRISYDAIKTSFKIALREGVTPNIAGLKALQEEYKNLETSTERAQFVLKKFGRGGMEMQKILELDAKALDEMAQSAEDVGLVMSEQAVQATIDYYEATDQLGDQLEGLKVQTGMAIIPALTETVTLLNENTAAMRFLKKAYDDGKISRWEYIKTFLTEGVYSERNAELLEKLRIEIEAVKAAEEDELSVKQEYIYLMNNAADATWGAFYALQGMPTVTADMADAFKNAEGILATAAKNMEKFSLQVLYNKAVQDLDAEAAIKLGSELGILDGRTVMAADAVAALTEKYDTNKDGVIEATEMTAQYILAIQELYNKINALPEERTVRINLIINENLNKLHKDKEEDVLPWQPGKASGGYVSPMQPYIVGERGPELFVPNTAGNIIPNNKLRASAGGGGVGGDVYVTQHFYSEGAAALGMAIVSEASGKRLDASMGG